MGAPLRAYREDRDKWGRKWGVVSKQTLARLESKRRSRMRLKLRRKTRPRDLFNALMQSSELNAEGGHINGDDGMTVTRRLRPL